MRRSRVTTATLAALLLVGGCADQGTDTGEANGATAAPAFVVPTSPVAQAPATAIPVPERFQTNPDEFEAEGAEGEGAEGEGAERITEAQPIDLPNLRPGQWIGEQVALDLCRSQIDGRPVLDETPTTGATALPDDPTAILVCEDAAIRDGVGRAAVITGNPDARRLADRIEEAAKGRCPDFLPTTVGGYVASVVLVDRRGATTRIFVSWMLYGNGAEVTAVGDGCGPRALIDDLNAIALGRGATVFEAPVEPLT